MADAHGHTHESHSHESHSHESHSHDEHGHAHRPLGHAAGAPASRLRWALLLTGGFLVVEVVFGFLSGSLALLSDAGHMLTDAGALALALMAQRIAERGRTRAYTFGFRRAEILAALLNGVVLGVSAIWVIVEAVRRWRDPPEIAGGWMLGVAFVGLLVNLAAAWVLGYGTKQTNANMRAALAHVLADAAGSVAAIVAAIIILTLGWRQADPAVSILISLLILWGSARLVRGSVDVLMETAPAGVDHDELLATIRATPGVEDVHDLHVWSISEGFPLVTVHVVLDGSVHGTDVAKSVGQRVRDEHRIAHVTVQPEAPRAASLVPVERLRRHGAP